MLFINLTNDKDRMVRRNLMFKKVSLLALLASPIMATVSDGYRACDCKTTPPQRPITPPSRPATPPAPAPSK